MFVRRVAITLIAVALLVPQAFAAPKRTSKTLEKRVKALEVRARNLTNQTDTLSLGQTALQGTVSSLGDTTTAVERDVAELKKTFGDYINGASGAGSTRNVKTIEIDLLGTAGFLETDCQLTFSSTSPTEGTFFASPFFCFVSPLEWSSPVTIGGKYEMRGSSIVFFDYLGNDPGGVMNRVTSGRIAADAIVTDDSINLNLVFGYGDHYIRVEMKK